MSYATDHACSPVPDALSPDRRHPECGVDKAFWTGGESERVLALPQQKRRGLGAAAAILVEASTRQRQLGAVSHPMRYENSQRC